MLLRFLCRFISPMTFRNGCICAPCCWMGQKCRTNYSKLTVIRRLFSVEFSHLLSKYCECDELWAREKNGTQKWCLHFYLNDGWAMQCLQKFESVVVHLCHLPLSVCAIGRHLQNAGRPRIRVAETGVPPSMFDQKWSPSTSIIYSIETETDLSSIHHVEQNRREYILC